MAVEIWSVLDFVAVTFTIVSVLTIHGARQRFSSTPIRRFMGWILGGAILFLIIQIALASRIVISDILDFVFVIRAIFATSLSICLIGFAYEVKRFAKVYGFSKSEKESLTRST